MAHPDDKIGPYTLVQEIGRGHFGIVWLAEKRTTIATTRFALKMARDDNVDLEAFRQEAAIWVQASGHPNVLPIIEADVYAGQVVIVSEYAPDGSLTNWLRRHGGKAPYVETAVEMGLQILAGLEHLHDQRIIHRDIKPDNILLQRGTPRLADFGLARLHRLDSYSAAVKGTFLYMAPEAFNRKRNEQTDVWSVGVVLYQMLTGWLPYEEPDLTTLVGAIINRDPAPLPALVPESLRRVVAGALQRAPSQRYKSAAEMRRALLVVSREIRDPALPSTLEDVPPVGLIQSPPAGRSLTGNDTLRFDERPIVPSIEALSIAPPAEVAPQESSIPGSIHRSTPQPSLPPRTGSKKIFIKPLIAVASLFVIAAIYLYWARPFTRWLKPQVSCVKSADREIQYYEAEYAVLSGGAREDRQHLGFFGLGYVSGYGVESLPTAVTGVDGPSTTFWVDAASDGQYRVDLCYGNGNDSPRTLTIYVNDEFVKRTTLPNAARWNIWLTQAETLPLRAGRNAISYRKSEYSDGEVNLDFIGIGPLIASKKPSPLQSSPSASPSPLPSAPKPSRRRANKEVRLSQREIKALEDMHEPNF
jgi:serine/threonine protein kinase